MHQELRLLEAILFASSEPVTVDALTERLPEGADVSALIAELKARFCGHGVELIEVAGGWAFRTAPDLASLLKVERKVSRKPSRAAIETLAIVAYHQPVTRGEVEQIRGVAVSKGTFDVLLEAGWIRPMGRRKTPGRPVTWGTSAVFLEEFGLSDIRDLPGIDELRAAGLLDSRPASAIVGPASDTLPEPPAEDEPAEEPLVDEDAVLAEEPLLAEEAPDNSPAAVKRVEMPSVEYAPAAMSLSPREEG